jgi:hypothetical protein
MQDAATLQAVLEGVPLPADRRTLIRYAREQRAEERLLGRLAALPDREYRTLDEVGEELVPVQPSWPSPQADVPRPESGEPPGGDGYVRRR